MLKTPGSFCVNPKHLFEILKELPNANLSLLLNEENSNILNIHCKDIHFTLRILQDDDFPQLLFLQKEGQVRIETDLLLMMIEKTSLSISDDETQIYFNGMFLQKVGLRMRAVGTDGNRLSLVDADFQDDASSSLLKRGIIIPKKGVYELKRMAESFPGKTISLTIDDVSVHAQIQDIYHLSILLIEQDYPKYEAVIPEKTSFLLKVDRKIFIDAVRRIKIMSNEKYNGVKIILKNSEMVLTSQIPIVGAADEKIKVEYTGKEMEICFNARYLMDALSPLEEGSVLLEINNQFSPILFKSENLPDYLGVVMPPQAVGMADYKISQLQVKNFRNLQQDIIKFSLPRSIAYWGKTVKAKRIFWKRFISWPPKSLSVKIRVFHNYWGWMVKNPKYYFFLFLP